MTEETFRLDITERPQQMTLKFRAAGSAGGSIQRPGKSILGIEERPCPKVGGQENVPFKKGKESYAIQA